MIFMLFNRYNLIEAIKNNDTNQINFILKNKKTNINAKDKDGWTALIWASCKGDLETVKLLIDNGADINLISKYTGLSLDEIEKL